MMRNSFWAAVTALAMLCGCDRTQSYDFKNERNDPLYKAAMEEYSAGRHDQAAAKFEAVLKANPSNASARFQLACLLQDKKQDYLGAYCHYREYLLLAGSSDKASLARDRAEICEKQLAKELAKKMNLTDNAELAKESETARAELEKSIAKCAALEKDLAAAEAKAVKLESENDRLRRMMSGRGETGGAVRKATPSVQSLLDGDDGDDYRPAKKETPVIDDQTAAAARRIVSPEPDGSAAKPRQIKAPVVESAKPRRAMSVSAAKDVLEEESKPLLPVRAVGEAGPGGPSMSDLVRAQQTVKTQGFPAKPSTYTVQEGETLSMIALRFYGKKSAWKQIQAANRATISNDGRVKVGQTIILP